MKLPASKLIAALVLGVTAHVATAATAIVNFEGTITSSVIGASTNPVATSAIGQTFTYTLTYNDATSPVVQTNRNIYYGNTGGGWTASLRIGSYTFAPTGFGHEVVFEEQTTPFLRDTLRVSSYNTELATWTAHGLNFINTQQLFTVILQDTNGQALPSRNLTSLDDIVLSSFNGSKMFGFGAFDPVIGANIEIYGTVTSFTVGPLATVPEPASFAAVVGALALGCVAFRRRRKVAA